MSFLDEVKWDAQGLVPAITQAYDSGRLLTLAWMNREALQTTIDENRAVYWSRSRQRLWRKGEESGHIQRLVEVQIDCDADAIVLRVEQVGGFACHTGRASCFYRTYLDGNWVERDRVIKDPAEIYRHKT